MVVLTLIVNIVTVGMLSFYLVDRFRIKYYNPNRYRAFMINSVLMFVSGKLVHTSTIRTLCTAMNLIFCEYMYNVYY